MNSTTMLTTDAARATSSPSGSSGSDSQLNNLTTVLEALDRETRECEDVSVEHVMDAFQGRLFGPLMIVLGLLLMSPVGAVPFLPAVVAVLMFLVAGQKVMGRDKPWVPKWIAERSVKQSRLSKSIEWLTPWTKRVDTLVKPRLKWLVRRPMRRAMAASACLMSLLIFPLAPIPFAVWLPAGAIVMFGLALIARDGVLAAIGLTLTLVAVGVALSLLF